MQPHMRVYRIANGYLLETAEGRGGVAKVYFAKDARGIGEEVIAAEARGVLGVAEEAPGGERGASQVQGFQHELPMTRSPIEELLGEVQSINSKLRETTHVGAPTGMISNGTIPFTPENVARETNKLINERLRAGIEAASTAEELKP